MVNTESNSMTDKAVGDIVGVPPGDEVLNSP